MANIIEDFPPGPLDFYRKTATFDWKKMKMFLYKEEELKYLDRQYEELRKHPEFLPTTKPLSFDEERRRGFKQFALIKANENTLYNLNFPLLTDYAVGARIKYVLSYPTFMGVVKNMGTERHVRILKNAEEGKIRGCFCLTEVGHGSNIRGMRTTATYDAVARQFILNTPDFQAAKCWAGGLGNSATHAVVYAQLHTQNKSYGLHIFVVPLRDPATMLPFPGVTVGDMGPKMGLNEVDNGFVMFHNYKIPRENLLNKNCDVSEDGRYVNLVDEKRRFSESVLVLSATRAGIVLRNEGFGSRALAIAVRYAAVRKQFGPQNEEIPILEYQTHQYRLLPYVAAIYVLKVFGMNLDEVFRNYLEKVGTDQIPDLLGVELHIITSAAKPVSGWLMRDAIQSCREACGGHGYLKASGLGDLKNDQEPALTYEGDNWVLIQQTSNFLLKLWDNMQTGVRVKFPLKSGDFLKDARDILWSRKFTFSTADEVCQAHNILWMYQWVVCYLLKETHSRYLFLLEFCGSSFSAKNNVQVFYAKKLGEAFIEHFFLQQFLDKIQTADEDLKNVLNKLLSLYGLFSLQKYLTVMYQGGFASGSKPALLIQDGIVDMCENLKNDAVALVDAFAPPDFILNSVLGMSDGKVYEHLEKSFRNSPYGTGRPTWWKDMVNWKDLVATSKL